ncbi:NAD(P)-dependent oxidoreductase [Candidatus Pacearchaeota archaeon]|nr:NAD(P)-dependent oxidoreductase [Candidatus Pacearchaeota archaeon]
MKEKLLITGGSGFVGTNVIKGLESRFDITNVDKNPSQTDVKTVIADLNTTDYSFLKEDFDYVLHLAALSNPKLCGENPEDALRDNVFMFDRLLTQLNKKTLKKIIFTSSYLVYGKADHPLKEDTELEKNPNIYCATKILGEKLCGQFRERGMPIITFRFCNLFGPYQQEIYLLPQLINGALEKGEISVRNTYPIRDFMYIEEVAKAVNAALTSDYIGVLNIGSGEGTSVREIVDKISKLTRAKIVGNDEKKPEYFVCDSSRAEKTVGWKAKTSLEEGINRTIEYYRSLRFK